MGYLSLYKVGILLKPQLKGHPSWSSLSTCNPLHFNTELSINQNKLTKKRFGKHWCFGGGNKRYSIILYRKKIQFSVAWLSLIFQEDFDSSKISMERFLH